MQMAILKQEAVELNLSIPATCIQQNKPTGINDYMQK